MGVAIGLALAFVVNLLVAAIIGLAKMAIIGTLVLVVAWLVLVGPPERKR